jgi:hypothetical protein
MDREAGDNMDAHTSHMGCAVKLTLLEMQWR